MTESSADTGAGERGTRHFGYGRFAAMVSALLLAGLAAVPLAAIAKGEAGPALALLLVATSLVFLFGLLIVAERLKWSGSVLSIGPEGICDRRIGPATIPWERIRQIHLFRARSQLYLAVIPDDPHAFIDPPGRLAAFVVRVNTLLRMPLLSLSLTGLDASRRQIVLALRANLPAHLADEEG